MTFLLEQQFEIYLNKIDLFLLTNDHVAYPDYTTAYMAGALTQTLIHWFKQSFDLSIEELSRLTEAIIPGSCFKLDGVNPMPLKCLPALIRIPPRFVP